MQERIEFIQDQMKENKIFNTQTLWNSCFCASAVILGGLALVEVWPSQAVTHFPAFAAFPPQDTQNWGTEQMEVPALLVSRLTCLFQAALWISDSGCLAALHLY